MCFKSISLATLHVLFKYLSIVSKRFIIMGKIRRKGLRAAKSDPLAASLFAPVDDLQEEDELDQSMGPIEVIREQLQNVNIEEKINGLQALATYSGNKEKMLSICQNDIIRIASPLLIEKDLSVRSAAAGALRNFSVCGTEICNLLVQQDVPTPLLALLTEYMRSSDWVPTFDANMHGEMDLRSDIFLHAINLLWNLCESSSLALDQLNQTELMGGLIRCLDYNVFGLDIAISVAQCLLVVSENNVKCWNIINEHVNTFIYLLDINGEHGYAFLRSLAAGILCNVPALAAAHGVAILQCVSKTLEVNHTEATEQLLNTAASLSDKNGDEVTADETLMMEDETEEAAAQRRRRTELPTQRELILRNVGYMLDSQRVAAEVATNLLCNEEEEWVDEDDDDDNDSETGCIMDYDGKSDSQTNLNSMDNLSTEILEVIKSTLLVDKFWQRAKPLTDNLMQRLRNTEASLVSKVKYLRYSTLLCLQNLCNILSIEDLGGVMFLYDMWVALGEQMFKGPQEHVELLEPSTALMRSALEHLKVKKELFSQLTQSDLQLILNGVKVCTMAEVRANWLRMLGNLGCLLTEELTKSTMIFLIQCCSNEEDAWTMSETLDVLMDMFSDNDWPGIVSSINLAQQLKNLERIFKTKVRQQKRDLNERYAAVRTVQQNLPRFIKYIEKEASKV